MNPQQLEFRSVEGGVELGADFRAEIILDGFHVIAGGREDHAAPGRDMEPAQTEFRHVEILRRAAQSLHAAAERDGRQVALQIVCPVVIRADETVRSAAVFAAEFHPAMGAPVLEDVYFAVHVAGDDDRIRADIGPHVTARFGDFAVEPDVIPVPAEKNLLDLAFVDVLIGIDPVGDAGFIRGPGTVRAVMPVGPR